MRIGIFDSGIGGLTVLKKLIQDFPHNHYFYLGDTANVPYGTKSTEQIKSLCRQATSHFKDLQIDVLVVACNTASSLALREIKETIYPIPVIGVVEPGVFSILSELEKKQMDPDLRILVLGTAATVRSGVYGVELRKRISFNPISEQSCPIIVPLIEEGWIASPILPQVILEYVRPYIDDKKPGIALLACTHYPWAQAQFAQVLKNWSIVNSSQAIANSLVGLFPDIKNSNRKFMLELTWTDPKSVSDFALNDIQLTMSMNLKLRS